MITIVPTILVLSVGLVVNLLVSEFTGEVLYAAVIILLCLLATQFAVYSCVVALCLCVKAFVEIAIYLFIFVIGGYMCAYGLTVLIDVFLYGNGIGAQPEAFASSYYNMMDYFEHYNPIYMGMGLLREYSMSYRENAFVAEAIDTNTGYRMLQVGRSVAAVVTWSVVAVFLMFVSGRLFQKLKAENMGTIGLNPYLLFIGTSIIMISAFSVPFGIYGSVLLRCITGFVIGTILFFLSQMLLRMQFKLPKAALKQYGLTALIIGAICMVCVTGMFGYSSYQPKLDEITEASVTYKGATDTLFNKITGYRGLTWYDDESVYGTTASYTYTLGKLLYTSQKDLQTILDLHNELIQMGDVLNYDYDNQAIREERDRITSQITIGYRLKNGKEIIRHYKNITPAAASRFLALDNTDAVKQASAECLEMMQNPDWMGGMYISDLFYENNTSLTPEQRAALLACLQKDFDSLSLQEKYFPENETLAVISYRGKSDNNTDIGYSLSDIYANAEGQIFISAAYPHTVAYLTQNQLLPASSWKTADISEILVDRYVINSRYGDIRLYFHSHLAYEYKQGRSTLTVSPADYEDILSVAKTHYYVTGGGYLVTVPQSAGNEYNPSAMVWTKYFIPEQDAPDWVKKHFENFQ